jgi:hypothetical protein
MNGEEEVINKQWFRSRAKQMYHKEGEIEIDEGAPVSQGDDEGAYVQAWVWVPSPEGSAWTVTPSSRKQPGNR